ncbi:MAG TPA: carbohydrate kinase family protein [Solirubrobacteraceae bacterium]|nr:carbohydrate kinase family protein [Solirubrobacteraceae bacterium]
MTIVVAGDVMADVVVTLSGPVAHGSDTPARIAHRGGGAAANLAVWLARAGAGVHLIGRVGDDAAGRAVAEELAAAGVAGVPQIDPALGTGTCVVLVEPGGERSMLPDAGANAALAATPLPEGAVHLHVAGYALLHPGSRPAARALLAQARAAGVPVSVDPSSAAPLAREPAFLEWVAGADLLLPNRAEAAVLAGTDDPEAAARTLAARGREVVVTLGAEGALWTDGEAVVRAPAVAAGATADTTGAGDAFAAGLLAARLGGAAPAEALAAGCALAAGAVARNGAR